MTKNELSLLKEISANTSIGERKRFSSDALKTKLGLTIVELDNALHKLEFDRYIDTDEFSGHDEFIIILTQKGFDAAV